VQRWHDGSTAGLLQGRFAPVRREGVQVVQREPTAEEVEAFKKSFDRKKPDHMRTFTQIEDAAEARAKTRVRWIKLTWSENVGQTAAVRQAFCELLVERFGEVAETQDPEKNPWIAEFDGRYTGGETDLVH
jgi:hypothetical protein